MNLTTPKLIIIWSLLTLLAAAGLTYQRLDQLSDGLRLDGQILHRLISQRADQHDAHMTGLSALANSSEKPPRDTLLSLAETIRRFYPRIHTIDLVALHSDSPVVISTRQVALNKDWVGKIKAAAKASKGQLQILPNELGYLLIKRSPNNANARNAVVLGIDAKQLSEPGRALPVGTTVSLHTASGETVMDGTADNSSEGLFPRQLGFQKTLGSRSQPLILSVGYRAPFSEWVPVGWIALVALLLAAIMLATRKYLQQRHKVQAAERRALLGEQEARIAQASRINGLGEMASGIAHELNQPLTAILSQSQAGSRMLNNKPDDPEAVSAVLSTISEQAKRAGAILIRLRNWTSSETHSPEVINLNEVATGIAELMQADLKSKGIQLQLNLANPAPHILADPVQIEQVLFNLARNGAEAVADTPDPQVTIHTQGSNPHAIMGVEDNGMGIGEEILPRLNEPFFSTKEEGMGLGLSLCENIVARFDGNLEISNRPEGGVRAQVTFPITEADPKP